MKKAIFFICVFFVCYMKLTSAHAGPLILYNELFIEDNKVGFRFQDSPLYDAVIDEIEGVPYINKSIIVMNDNEQCMLYEFIPFGVSKENMFVANCKNKITQLAINDTFFVGLHGDKITKVYNVHYYGNTKSFLGEDTLNFTLNVSGNFLIRSREENDFLENFIFLKYFKLGIKHILSGPDHILFILGFIILATTFLGLVKGVSGFTLSHSATLTISALGIFVLSAKIVEPMIALSIVIVGILGIFDIGKGWLTRFGIIFGFGLFHGLGFAGAVSEVGFPKIGFLSAILGFNVGVEAGQLLIVLLTYPFLVYLAKKKPKTDKIIRKSMAFLIVGAGFFWMMQRLFFV